MTGLVGLGVAIGLWGAWVTREVARPATTPRFVRVQLSSMIGEYVSAQARTQTPPDTVTAQTKAFMRAVQGNLEARGAQGQVVLVGEAVLAGDVPDVTQAVRREVYARIPVPDAGSGAGSPVMDAMREAMARPAGRARPATTSKASGESDVAAR
ncbi:TrbI F-type domain-containing protein [Novosphingobium sp. SL115]|uniref:TrbI F-type domain-containing protein n=1 Tax=Novosphingobium sp. SL115 TaxID=2995150 RepID=UPI002277044E|nr:TrbI F-type domain-containing protein [Novosphingobium sp. SL115]MCY1669613.1 TrbI F-type domain-containing protein [Novosphingobium sp. SL115]